MRRAECSGPGAALTIVECPIPEPPVKGLVVKAVYSGVCHSDCHVQDGYFNMGGENKFNFSNVPDFDYPLVFGHEVAGTVHSIGEDATDSGLLVGDKVIVYPWVSCMECEECLSDHTLYCKSIMRFLGGIFPGGFATHVSVPLAKFAVKVPDGIPLDVGSLTSCSGTTAYNGVTTVKPVIEKAASFRSNVSVLIVGAGGLGCWAIKLAKALLPSKTRVLVADIMDDKLVTAREMGADHTVLWSPIECEEVLVERTKAITGGVDAVIDLVGNGTTNTRGLAVLKKGGILVCIGFLGGCITLPVPALAFDSRIIAGCAVGSLADLKALLELIVKNKMSPVPISHHSLDEVDELLNLLRAGKIKGRAVLKFSE